MNTCWQPDIVTDQRGNPRCAGFELEFGDLAVRRPQRRFTRIWATPRISTPTLSINGAFVEADDDTVALEIRRLIETIRVPVELLLSNQGSWHELYFF